MPALLDHVDWRYLIQLARRHAMLPIVYQALSSTYPRAVPKAMLNLLRARYYDTARYNLMLATELLRVLKLFEAHAVPAIPLKGPILAVGVYGNLALREFDDLDILVRKSDVRAATELLVAEGYRITPGMTDEQIESWLRSPYHCDYTLISNDGLVKIELHWGLITKHFGVTLDHEAWWDRVETVSLGRTSVPSPSPEDLLLYLCVHGGKHLWQRFLWLCDVARLIETHPTIQWTRVMKEAHARGIQRMFLLALYMANELLEIALPENVSKEIAADRTLPFLSARICRMVLRTDLGALHLYLYALQILMRERWRDKISLLGLIVAPNERDQAILALPEYLSFLYYPLRPIRLLIEYGPVPFRYLLQLSRRVLRL